ncbi:MAG: hypothetical protein ACRD0P_22250 [Stackebrandtia sp.]
MSRPPGVLPVALELSDDVSARRCVTEVVNRAGRIDAVVYSAGYFVAGVVEETTADLAVSQFDAYVVGAHRALRYEVEPLGIDVTCVQGTGVRTGAADSVRLTPEPIAAYEPSRTKVIERFLRDQAEGPSPRKIAAAIVRAVEADRMRPRYRVGFLANALPVMRTLMPLILFRRLFARSFGHTG